MAVLTQGGPPPGECSFNFSPEWKEKAEKGPRTEERDARLLLTCCSYGSAMAA